jgi:hypothetical protein
VLLNGQIDWVQDAYTTTDNYPYSQNANTSALPAGSGLNQTFNYVRNSVKVLINAYSGKMTFYVTDPSDPIIRAYENAFHGMFTPASKMSAQLKAHLRYPEDIFAVQATMFGKYHITTASSFYSAADAWQLSPSPGSGSPSTALPTTLTTNAQGQQVSTGQLVRMAPLYQELRIPGQAKQSFNLLDAFVPISGQSQIQTLSGFMMAGSDPGHYGQLEMFVTPRDSPVTGPAIVASQIDAAPGVSQAITFYDQSGSSVLLGNLLMIPVADSLLYIQPMYVQSSRNPIPVLTEVIAAYGKQVQIKTTLSAALQAVFGAPVSTSTGGSGTGTLSPEVRSLLDQAQTAYQQAQADLKAQNLGAYQADVNALEGDLNQVQDLTGGTTTPTTTTTTTVPGT